MSLDYPFTDLIIQCCQLSESALRGYIKEVLAQKNFVIQEDDYCSARLDCADIHNLLAIRGTPQVCLVSHTDVCRDHLRYQGNPPDKTPACYQVQPVIKTLTHGDQEVAVIQDQDCLAQVGGDDRVGVAIALSLALTTDLPLALLFTTDEEIGLVSAKYVDFPELMNYQLLVEIDRGNQPDQQIVTEIFEQRICNINLSNQLVDLSQKIGYPRQEVAGKGTDVFAIKMRDKCQNAINLTCGYHNSFASNPSEYIVISEAEHTLHYVKTIVELF